MRPKGTAEELQKRRFHAIELLRQGYGPTEVSSILQVERRTVQRWHERQRESGERGLKAKPHPGRHPKLLANQKTKLVQILLEGPKAHGFSTELWSGPRIARLIRRSFGVQYHPNYVPRLLRSLGWSPQRPERKAYEKDERAVAHWLGTNWPRIKKGSQE
jgi:transposase